MNNQDEFPSLPALAVLHAPVFPVVPEGHLVSVGSSVPASQPVPADVSAPGPAQGQLGSPTKSPVPEGYAAALQRTPTRVVVLSPTGAENVQQVFPELGEEAPPSWQPKFPRAPKGRKYSSPVGPGDICWILQSGAPKLRYRPDGFVGRRPKGPGCYSRTKSRET